MRSLICPRWIIAVLATLFLASGAFAQNGETVSQYQLTLYVSNQSFDITPVDIDIWVDGSLIVSDVFHVADQHNWKSFDLMLEGGSHELRVRTEEGEADLFQTFEISTRSWAVVDFWFYPESHYNATPRQFTFSISDEPVYFD